jgi:hypothetical protein
MIAFQKQRCDEKPHIYDVALVSSHPNVIEKAATFTMIQPYS